MTTALRVSWAVMNPTPPLGKIQLMDARHAVAAGFVPGATHISKRAGLLPGPGTPAAVTATSPTPDNMVSVAPFQCVLSSGRALAGAVAAPPYVATSDRAVAFNAFATPPSAVANRRDLIILQQNDSSHGVDVDSEANLRYVVGNAPAADPPIDGSPDYVIIAQVVVRQNAVSVLQTDITSRTPAGFSTVGLGGILPVLTVAERDAIPTPYEGFPVWRADKGWSELRFGSGWRIVGVPTVSTFAALATDITHPYTGQLASVSTEGRYYRYTGAAWVHVLADLESPPRAQLRQTALQSLTGGVFNDLVFQTEDRDSHDGHAGANSFYTIPKTGDYLHVGGVATAAGAGFRATEWTKNGATILGSGLSVNTLAGAVARFPARGMITRFNAGDLLRLRCFTDVTVDTSVAAGVEPTMTVLYVGA